MRWQPGDAIVRRELVHGRPWLGQPALVVEDTAELLAIYVPGGSKLAFPDGDWPGGRHPWWWSDEWAHWEPETQWAVPELPEGWDRVE